MIISCLWIHPCFLWASKSPLVVLFHPHSVWTHWPIKPHIPSPPKACNIPVTSFCEVLYPNLSIQRLDTWGLLDAISLIFHLDKKVKDGRNSWNHCLKLPNHTVPAIWPLLEFWFPRSWNSIVFWIDTWILIICFIWGDSI